MQNEELQGQEPQQLNFDYAPSSHVEIFLTQGALFPHQDKATLPAFICPAEAFDNVLAFSTRHFDALDFRSVIVRQVDFRNVALHISHKKFAICSLHFQPAPVRALEK